MKQNTILDKIFLYKNVKIILLIIYLILTLIIYLNWDYLSDLWFDYLMKINQRFEEPYSFILIFCYCFYSFYGVIFLYYPLLFFDKKYENNDRIEINHKKEYTFKSVQNTLLFIVSPILLLVGGILFVGIWYVADIALGIWSLIGIFVFVFILLFMPIYYLYKVLKKYYVINRK